MTLRIIASILTLSLSACAGGPTLSTRDVTIDSSYTGGPVADMLVLSLQEDRVHDSRVIIERGFVEELRQAEVNATAGYTRFDSIDALINNPQTFEAQLREMEVASVLFIEPIKLDTDYDPAAYAERRSAYRALGLDSSASANLLGQIAAEASAAKVILNVGLWLPGSDKDLFNSTYDINAPGNYDVDVAREYTAAFAANVIADLRQYGFVK